MCFVSRQQFQDLSHGAWARSFDSHRSAFLPVLCFHCVHTTHKKRAETILTMNNSPVKEHACPTREEKDVMHPGKWKLFALGQLVSLLYVTGGAFQSSLAWECDISAPLSTAGMLYLSLTVLLIPLCWTRTERAKYAQAPEVQSDTEANGEQCLRHTFLGLLPIQGDPWAYCGVGFLDFLGVFLYSRALHETTISNASFYSTL